MAAVARSGAMRVLNGLNGGPFAIGQKVATEQFVGRGYRVKVDVNPDSNKGRLYVAMIELLASAPHLPANGAAVARPASAPTQRAPAPPRPPAPKAPTPPAAPPEQKYWCLDADGNPIETPTSHHEVQTHIAASKIDPTTYLVCPVGQNEYRPASEFGFKETTPF